MTIAKYEGCSGWNLVQKDLPHAAEQLMCTYKKTVAEKVVVFALYYNLKQTCCSNTPRFT